MSFPRSFILKSCSPLLAAAVSAAALAATPAMAQATIGQTTTGANAAVSTAGAVQPLPSSSSLNKRTYAPGTREDFEHHPLPQQDRALFHIGNLPVRSRTPVMPAYNGSGTYSTVAGQPANGKNGMSAQIMADRPQGADSSGNPAPIP